MLPECLLGLPALWGQIAGLRKRWVRVGKRAEILRQCPRSQFFPQTGELDLSLPGALDLFSGSYGVACDMVKCGCPCVLTFEIHHSADEDLLIPKNKACIMELLELEAFDGVGMAPVCCSFYRAVTPAVRSRRFPRDSWFDSSRVQEG